MRPERLDAAARVGAGDAVFNAMRAIECRADPEHFDSASPEAYASTCEGDEAAEASGRSEGLWVPSAL